VGYTETQQQDRAKAIKGAIVTANGSWSGKRPTSGMIPRKLETLKGPLTLARVGHSSKQGAPCSHEDNLGSPWWLSVGTLEYLWGLSRNSGTPLSTLVRQKCCVPYYWNSSCDLIYEFDLVGYLDCWIGPGTFFFPEKNQAAPAPSATSPLWPAGDVVFFPAGEFPQIFIPGAWDKSVRQLAWSNARVMDINDAAKVASYLAIPRIKV
jgi:hypothetical protein